MFVYCQNLFNSKQNGEMSRFITHLPNRLKRTSDLAQELD